MSCRQMFYVLFLILLCLVACSPNVPAPSTSISPSATLLSPTQTLIPPPTNTQVQPSDTSPPPKASQTSTPTIQPTSTPEPTRPAFEVIEGIAYANTDPIQTLSIYLPQAEDIKPLTLLVAGGEYYPSMLRYFAEMGYPAIAFNTRSDFYQEEIQDGFCALAWAHTNADIYGFSAEGIIPVGGSMWGGTAALLSLVDDPTPFLEECPHVLPEAKRVHAVITLAGVFDYSEEDDFFDGFIGSIGSFMGGIPEEVPDNWAAASAINWINGEEPPFLLIHGTADTNVHMRQSEKFASALESVGSDVELILLPGINHYNSVTDAKVFDAILAYLKTLEQEGTPFEGGNMTYGGTYNDRAFDVLVTEDGGSLIAGLANNTGLSHRITPGNALLIRTDWEGSLIWEKEYGGEDDASFSSIIQVGNDEYLALGEIAGSYLRDETDVYLVKVDGQGNEIWSRTFGGRGMDHGKMIQKTEDGGYILIGSQADEFPTANVYEGTLLLIKTDAEGHPVWSRTYGDEILYLGWGVAQTPDGGYILSGWEAKTIDDRDVILIKTDALGEVEWSRTWDLGERDGGFDLILTSDGYVVIACIQSMGSGGPSAVLIKVDLEGNEIWNKLIGEEGVGNTFWHIVEDSDGGYLMVGDTHLGKMPGTGKDIHGAWMIKTNSNGEILWQKVIGNGIFEQAHFNSAALIPGKGYVFVGDVTRDGEIYSDIFWMRVDH